MMIDQTGLKKKMQDIIDKNKPSAPRRTKPDKDILYYESELITNNVLFDFSISLDELDETLKGTSFGGTGFYSKDYSLSWLKHGDTTYRLHLTNTVHNNSKLLIECPVNFKAPILLLLPLFIEQIAGHAKKLLES